MKTYKARNGNIQYKQSIDTLMEGTENGIGYCLACGEQNENIEPDARKYNCQCCNAPKVYGCEELMLMGLYYSTQGVPDNRTSHDYGNPRTQVSE